MLTRLSMPRPVVTAFGIMAYCVLLPSLSPRQTQAQLTRCGTASGLPCSASNVAFNSVSSGQFHSCGVAVDSTLWCWGDGRSGALGNGRSAIERFPQPVVLPTPFKEVKAGGGFTCARSTEDRVYCWGHSQVVAGWPATKLIPVRVALDLEAQQLTVGRRHACVLDNVGMASCWGFNVDGQTGIGSGGVNAALVAEPTAVSTELRFKMIAAGGNFTCGVSADNRVYCWGSNSDSILGRHAAELCGDVWPVPCSTTPVEVELPAFVTDLSAGTSHACALSATNEVFCWGANYAGQAGSVRPGEVAKVLPAKVRIPQSESFVSIASGGIASCALTIAGLAFCWGGNNLNLGIDVDQESARPRIAAGGRRFKSLSVGSTFVCGIAKDGGLFCWGDTVLGALGAR